MSQGNNPSASARNAGRADQAPSAAPRGMKMPHPKSPTSSGTQGTPCSVLTTTSYWRRLFVGENHDALHAITLHGAAQRSKSLGGSRKGGSTRRHDGGQNRGG